MTAWDRVRSLTATGGDAFAMASGAYAAVLLAGFGLPVAPFDLKALRILAKPSKDIDTVLALFSRNKTALVGYSACDAPFYVLLTDCIRTLRQRVPSCPELADIKQLFGRLADPCPRTPARTSPRGMALFRRQPGDTISTVGVDPNRTVGSIMLYAGWQVDGEPQGAPNDGYFPVPGAVAARGSLRPGGCSLAGASASSLGRCQIYF